MIENEVSRKILDEAREIIARHAKEDDELFEKCKSLLKDPESDIGPDILFDYLFNSQFPYDGSFSDYNNRIERELNQELK
jgi:hypothetical protein